MRLQYLVYCGWLGFELLFVLRYVIETKGTYPMQR
jgi:hypothetical protein